MSAETATVGASMAIGAGLAVLWFVIFLVVFFGGIAPSGSDIVAGVMMSATFFAVVTLVPNLVDDKHRNLKSGLFRCLGAVIMAVPMFMGLFMYFLSGLKIANHQ